MALERIVHVNLQGQRPAADQSGGRTVRCGGGGESRGYGRLRSQAGNHNVRGSPPRSTQVHPGRLGTSQARSLALSAVSAQCQRTQYVCVLRPTGLSCLLVSSCACLVAPA